MGCAAETWQPDSGLGADLFHLALRRLVTRLGQECGITNGVQLLG